MSSAFDALSINDKDLEKGLDELIEEGFGDFEDLVSDFGAGFGDSSAWGFDN